jgi:membrane protein YdbS with pleckstrin-like domain
MTIGENAVLRASQWCYRGVWGFVTERLKVPAEPPHLAGADDHSVHSFRPAEGFLRYLKFFFWIGLFAIDIVLTIAWLVLLVAIPWLGIVLAPLAWAIIILPDIIAYVGIHLRYDTTWYVLSDRSMRIRRGLWTIHETTITYENIQNVSIRQGPMQRYFGIADVIVETAGGGAATSKGEHATIMGHFGLLEGISNADEVRSLILSKWGASRSSGVGDDRHEPQGALVSSTFSSQNLWTDHNVSLVEEIRDLAVQLARV